MAHLVSLLIYPLKMVMFNSYVKLPEGNTRPTMKMVILW